MHVTPVAAAAFTYCELEFTAILVSSNKVEIYQVNPEGLQIFLGYGTDLAIGILESAREALSHKLG